MVSRRHTRANIEQCPGYDPGKPKTWIQYLDANNLYGHATSQYLPTGGFKWVNPSIDEVLSTNDADEGYILEADIEYPVVLHDLHNDFPLSPETISKMDGVTHFFHRHS